MKSRARSWWLLAGAILVTVAAVGLVWPGQPEPVYRGRKLSLWLKDYYGPSMGGGRFTAADAVERIGTNALPSLVRWIQYQPPPWHAGALRVLSRVPGTWWLSQRLEEPEVLAMCGIYGFKILGPTARPALGDLARLARKPGQSSPRQLAMQALGYLGKDGLPVLIDVLERADVRGQTLAAETLIGTSERGVGITQALPGLLLFDRSLRKRERTANFDWGPYVSGFERHPDFLVPALTNCLCHSNPLVRVEAAQYLGHLGDKSVAAEPALSAAFNDPDEAVRQAATNAVKQIAEAVLKQEKAGMPVNSTSGPPVTGQTGLPVTGPPVKPVNGQ